MINYKLANWVLELEINFTTAQCQLLHSDRNHMFPNHSLEIKYLKALEEFKGSGDQIHKSLKEATQFRQNHNNPEKKTLEFIYRLIKM